MGSRPAGTAALGAVSGVAAGQTFALLRHMQRDIEAEGKLTVPVAVWMYVTYSAHAVTTVAALSRPSRVRPSGWTSRLIGTLLVSGGGATWVAGTRCFSSPTKVSGVESDGLIASGIYRWSRNPQYLGYVVLLSGLAIARRSFAAGVLAAVAAGIYRTWVPIEEKHLESTYGQQYRAYRQRTRRWFGRLATPTGR